jgi:DNA-binding IclR family transcriptional regulator
MRSTERDGGASVLERACSLLDALDADHPYLSVSELARRTGMAKSTTHRLVQELCRLGLLESTRDGIRLGFRLFEFGELVPRHRSLRDAALPLMEDLMEATHQRVHLAVLEGVEVVYVQILGSRAGMSMPSRIGGRLPAHATGVGKAIMAYSPPAVVNARIAAGLPRLSSRTIVLPGPLTRELAAIRDIGVAFDREESGPGVSCAAAPVFGRDGAVIAALSVSGRTGQIDVEKLAPAVKTAALALGRRLRTQLG